jgi:hypothetical protein
MVNVWREGRKSGRKVCLSIFVLSASSFHEVKMKMNRLKSPESPQLAGSAFKGFSYVKPDLTTHTAAAWVQRREDEAQHDQDFGFKKELSRHFAVP